MTDRPQSEPMSVGIPDGTPHPRQRHCSGACLLVDRAGYRELERSGVRWETRSEDVPTDGKAYARIECAANVETIARHHGTYIMGLCADCTALEGRFRAALAARTVPR